MIFVESETVELKSQVVADICKEIIAFANTKGGTIYIGVDDNGNIIGIEDSDRIILQVNNMVRDSIKPDVTMFIGYERLSVEEKNIIAISVNKGTGRPYYLASKGLKPGGVYVRNGTTTDPATDTGIRMMIKETDGDSFEAMRSIEQSLSFEAAERTFSKRKVAFDDLKMKTLGMLSSDGVYTNLALLLSDQCSQTVKVAVFSGKDKLIFRDRHEFSGSLFAQLEDVYAFLDMRNQTKASFEGLYRNDTRDYPEEALREALINALVHRDYSFGASILISVFDDRVEFVSVGGLPVGITLDDILLGLSACRNPKLASVFYRLELIEAYGTGIPKIINSYESSGLEPKIEVTNNAFKITLPNRNFAMTTSKASSDIVDSYEEKIMELVSRKGYVVRSDIDSLFNIAQTTSSRILKQMVENGLLIKEGKGRSIVYKRNITE